MLHRSLRLITFIVAWLSLAVVPTRAADESATLADIAQLHKNAERLYFQFKPKEAAADLQKILQADGRNFEALIKLARAHIDIGDMIAESGGNWKERRLKEYRTAEEYARKALKLDPNSSWSYFWVAASVGSVAEMAPVAKQVELAAEIRDAVEKSLALDPKNGAACHLYGVWHRKVAEIGGASRMFASLFFGKSVPQGSLDKSIEYLKKAVALNPTYVASRLDLARSHAAKKEWPAARALLKSIPEIANQYFEDAKHKREAEEFLDEIKER
ncbi:MAG: tetratricopeptide repeat protein [Deltaproteobacteria bacterium]|nr:tetratricopeptide repeat protein [Deltaproteobacteria bacterium]